jgi:hypothetical protein
MTILRENELVAHVQVIPPNTALSHLDAYVGCTMLAPATDEAIESLTLDASTMWAFPDEPISVESTLWKLITQRLEANKPVSIYATVRTS